MKHALEIIRKNKETSTQIISEYPKIERTVTCFDEERAAKKIHEHYMKFVEWVRNNCNSVCITDELDRTNADCFWQIYGNEQNYTDKGVYNYWLTIKDKQP